MNYVITPGKIFLLFLVMMHYTITPSWCSELTENDNIIRFAESLYDEGDYFRAIGEYKRYIFLNPKNDYSEKATFRIADSFFRAKQWGDAIKTCNEFFNKYPDSAWYYEVLYLKGRALKMNNQLEDALRTFEIIAEKNISNFRERAIYQEALLMLEMKQWQAAKGFLLLIPLESPLYAISKFFFVEIDKIEHVPHKSPMYAGLLAALVPGAGHLYTERPKDALVSFILNATFILGTLELLHHDNYIAGGIFAFLELSWYGGNIYSAVNSAHNYNRNKEDQFIRTLKDKVNVSFKQINEISSIYLSMRY